VLRRLQQGVTLTAREEGLMDAITQCWALMARQVGWVEFSEDVEVDEFVDKFVGTELFDIRGLNVFLMWLYYDQALSRMEWGWDKQSLARRARINNNISVIMASFLRNSEEYRFDILVHINRLDISFDLSLPQSWVCEMLKTADDLAYEFAICRYIGDNGYSQDSDEPERTINFRWMFMHNTLEVSNPMQKLPNPIKLIQNQKQRRHIPAPAPRLLLCTNRAIYVARPSFREPCTICTSDQFCPEGPVV